MSVSRVRPAAKAVTWFDQAAWPEATPPAIGSHGGDLLRFTSYDGGATFFGQLLGRNYEPDNTAFRYFRLQGMDGPTDYFQANELEVALVPGGPNVLTPSSAVTAVSFAGGWGTGFLVDGDATGHDYSSGSPIPMSQAWLQIDMGTISSIAEMRLLAGAENRGYRTPTRVEIRGSNHVDGSNYTALGTFEISPAEWQAGFVTFDVS
jgi:hypothetical protein